MQNSAFNVRILPFFSEFWLYSQNADFNIWHYSQNSDFNVRILKFSQNSDFNVWHYSQYSDFNVQNSDFFLQNSDFNLSILTLMSEFCIFLWILTLIF